MSRVHEALKDKPFMWDWHPIRVQMALRVKGLNAIRDALVDLKAQRIGTKLVAIGAVLEGTNHEP